MIKYIIIFLFLIVFLLGNLRDDVKLEWFAYKGVGVKTPLWFFTARLQGTHYKVTKVLNQVKSPYRLMLLLSAQNNLGTVYMKNITLKYKNNNQEILFKEEIKKDMPSHKNGKNYFIVTYIKNIDLEYNEIELNLDLILDKKSDKVYKIKKVFKKDYKEENNSFWDIILNAT